MPVPCSTNTGRSGIAAAPTALLAAAARQRSSGHRSPRSTSIETYSSTRPSVLQVSASGHACVGFGEADCATARPRLSTARKAARVASTSAALPYFALRVASSAGVGGGLRGTVAIRASVSRTSPRERVLCLSFLEEYEAEHLGASRKASRQKHPPRQSKKKAGEQRGD